MIELIDVRKRYRLRQVLKGVSFTVEKGRITCLIGVNGSGKSTIMKAIMRLVPIQAGNILIDGRALSGPDLYEKVAFIPDRLTMPPGMKLSEAMRFMRDFHRNWNEARGRELMAFFRLDASERIGNLSKSRARFGAGNRLCADGRTARRHRCVQPGAYCQGVHERPDGRSGSALDDA